MHTSSSSPIVPAAAGWSRRRWLQGLGGATLAASGALRLAWAQGPGMRGRCVVVMLRGALDGLAAVPAPGDPQWAALRGPLAEGAEAPLALDGFFALHPALRGLHGWYGSGELLVVHAVASPYRERSHFDAQQLLESGGERPFALSTGWIGRALPPGAARAVALAPAMPLALRGSEDATTWTPTRRAAPDDDLAARVARLYAQDPVLAARWQQVRALPAAPLADRADAADMAGEGDAMAPNAQTSASPRAVGAGFAALATQAGRFLAEPQGPAVAWLELGGWDTHTQQGPRLQRQLAALDGGLLALRAALGPLWADTTVLVMTEFGRSARPNGSGGTDHGTAGVAFVAGGAVAGGRVLADWPGLAPAQLHEGRDLRPTTDLRSLQRALLARHLGTDETRLSREVLPGSPASARGLWREA